MKVDDNAKRRSNVGIIQCAHKSIQNAYISYLVTIYLEDVKQTTYALFALGDFEGDKYILTSIFLYNVQCRFQYKSFEQSPQFTSKTFSGPWSTIEYLLSHLYH